MRNLVKESNLLNEQADYDAQWAKAWADDAKRRAKAEKRKAKNAKVS